MADVSPAQFAELLAQIVAQKLATQPARWYNVTRTDAAGTKTPGKIELPQAIAELVDELKMFREELRELRATVSNLSIVMDDNRKLARKILKRGQDEED